MALRTSSERPEKILVAMYKLGEGKTVFLDYDDIVVKAFEMFPGDFCLRKHPQFPDSSDIHKPLYGPLKRQGLIRSAQKSFSLTPLGVEKAQILLRTAGDALDDPNKKVGDRLSRAEETEIERMLGSEAFKFFEAGKSADVLDTDFFVFLGCTVRTPRNEFIGRLNACRAAISKAVKLTAPSVKISQQLSQLMDVLVVRFDSLINYEGHKRG